MLAAWLGIPTVTSLSRLPLLLGRHTKHLGRIRSISCEGEDGQWPLYGNDVLGHADSARFYHHLSNVTSLTLPPGADHTILHYLPAMERLHCASLSALQKAQADGATLTALRHLALEGAAPGDVPPALYTALHSLSLRYKHAKHRAGAASSCVTSLTLTDVSAYTPGLMAQFPRLRHLEIDLRTNAPQLLSEIAAMQPMPVLSMALSGQDWEAIAVPLAALTTLSSLALSSPDAATPCFPHLTRLILRDGWFDYTRHATPPPFMSVRRTNLRSLALSFMERSPSAVEWAATFIASLTTLTHLRIDQLHPGYFRAIEEHPRLELVRVNDDEPLQRHCRLEDFARTLPVCKVCRHYTRTPVRDTRARHLVLVRRTHPSLAHTDQHLHSLCRNI